VVSLSKQVPGKIRIHGHVWALCENQPPPRTMRGPEIFHGVHMSFHRERIKGNMVISLVSQTKTSRVVVHYMIVSLEQSIFNVCSFSWHILSIVWHQWRPSFSSIWLVCLIFHILSIWFSGLLFFFFQILKWVHLYINYLARHSTPGNLRRV
jgi:hypothetical protein